MDVSTGFDLHLLRMEQNCSISACVGAGTSDWERGLSVSTFEIPESSRFCKIFYHFVKVGFHFLGAFKVDVADSRVFYLVCLRWECRTFPNAADKLACDYMALHVANKPRHHLIVGLETAKGFKLLLREKSWSREQKSKVNTSIQPKVKEDSQVRSVSALSRQWRKELQGWLYGMRIIYCSNISEGTAFLLQGLI